MLGKFLKNLDKKKLKVFAVFLGFSLMAWSISEFSQTYESWVEVSLETNKLPDSLFIRENSSSKVRLRLRASGFKLLGLGMGKNSKELDLSSVSSTGSRFFLTDDALLSQWEGNFSNAEILSIRPDTLFFDLYQVRSRMVKVQANLGLELEQNHVLLGALSIRPDSVLIKGPASEIDSIEVIETEGLTLQEVADSFEQELYLIVPDEFVESEVSTQKVSVSGEVVKFSEKIFDLAIQVENVPEEYDIRIFPKTISILCKAGENDLREISEDNFKVVTVYDSTKVEQKTMHLSLSQQPENVLSVRLLQDEVKFVLEPK